VIYFATIGLYLQQMNFKANEACKVAKNAFGKYGYSSGVHILTPVNQRKM
jgi:hypothetical protein